MNPPEPIIHVDLHILMYIQYFHLQYEAVHPMEGWRDLRSRLDDVDRRVYAYVHPCLPEEPLVILHTALTQEPAVSIQGLMGRQGDPGSGEHMHRDTNHELDMSCTSDPKVAVFFSISATQPGLAGVDLGHFLIQKVAEKLLADFPSVKLLVTLSPMPNFRDWLCSRLAYEASQPSTSSSSSLPWLLSQSDGAELGRAWTRLDSGDLLQKRDTLEHPSMSPMPLDTMSTTYQPQQAAQLLSHWLEDDLWLKCNQVDKPLFKKLLLRLAARYLVHERRRNNALDPVANFHLRNGAQLWRINWG